MKGMVSWLGKCPCGASDHQPPNLADLGASPEVRRNLVPQRQAEGPRSLQQSTDYKYLAEPIVPT